MSSWKEKVQLAAQRNRLEIVKAKLSRREMMRLGLLTTGGSLVVKQGLSSRAFGAGMTEKDITLSALPPSPPALPWKAPMPRLTVKQPVQPQDMLHGPPDGTTLIDGSSKRINHQYCSYDRNTGQYGGGAAGNFAPRKFYELTAKETQVKLHPDYAPTTMWAFDGQVPGPMIQARYGEPVMVRFHNHLPSVNIRQNFGISEITTHLHNAHTPSESDGNPVDYFNSVNDPNSTNPFGFKDQHYPNVCAGFTDSRFGPQGDSNEALSSLWYHDHHLDYTAQNVYKGLFGCYTLFDDKDTGDGGGLRLPHGEFDVPIFFNDFLFDRDCQQVFDLFNLDGIMGDRFCANGVIQPFFNVKKRRYRFRLYNPGPSRWYEFALFDGVKFLPFWQISSDGNLLPQAVQVSSVRLSVAERVDIVVDFGKIAASRLYLVNRLEQLNGRGPTGRILNPGTPIVQINLTGSAVSDDSVDPAASPLVMRQLPDPDFGALLNRAAQVKTRAWRFGRGNGMWQVNGKLFDEHVISASVPLGSDETWIISNNDDGWRHPVHIHFEEHRTLSRNAKLIVPGNQVNATIDYARKDVVQLNGPEEVRIFMRFRDMKGRYVMHCHNVVHEDHAMMVRFDIV
jgi:FtsP/CotA-like multicopper oxidase with cupredoxin domain